MIRETISEVEESGAVIRRSFGKYNDDDFDIGWEGDAAGVDNPLSIMMDSDQTVGAIFIRDEADSDGDGLSNYRELVLYGTDPDDVDSDGDGFNDGEEVAVLSLIHI